MRIYTRKSILEYIFSTLKNSIKFIKALTSICLKIIGSQSHHKNLGIVGGLISMTKILGIFGKEDEKREQPRKKTSIELTVEEKAELEDHMNSGLSARESADALNLDITTVYNFRKNQQRKPGDSVTKEILSNKMQEREILKADYELAKLKLDLEQKQQSMELDRLKFQKELSEWKREILGEGQEMGLIDVINQLQALSTQQGQPMQGPQNLTPPRPVNQDHTQSGGSSPSPGVEEKPSVNEPPLTELTDDQIKGILARYDKKLLQMAKNMPDQLIMDKINQEWPGLSENTLNRAIEMIKNG